VNSLTALARSDGNDARIAVHREEITRPDQRHGVRNAADAGDEFGPVDVDPGVVDVPAPADCGGEAAAR